MRDYCGIKAENNHKKTYQIIFIARDISLKEMGAGQLYLYISALLNFGTRVSLSFVWTKTI